MDRLEGTQNGSTSSEGFPESLISPEIHEILNGRTTGLCGFSSNEESVAKEHPAYFHTNGSFNFKEIQKLFPQQNFLNNKYPELFTYENCVGFVNILRPIWKLTFQKLQEILQSNDESRRDFYSSLLSSILGNEISIRDLFSPGYLKSSKVAPLEGILLLTALVENFLGNIYYTVSGGIVPPHLLRDLLNTAEIKNTFGHFQIFMLQVLMGTPNSVNLRNITWHGFPTIPEIPDYYFSTVIVSILSLSIHLKENDFNLFKTFRKRKKYQKLDPIPEEICLVNYGLKIEAVEEEISKRNLLENATFLSKERKLIWHEIYSLQNSGKYEKFILLVLPQIETLLRFIYSRCSKNFDIRAKINEFYIIIDTIFEENLPNSKDKNEVFQYLDMDTLKFLYDIFISPNGPRIRDKISHGEVDLDELKNKRNISLILIYLSLNLIEFLSHFVDAEFHHRGSEGRHELPLKYSIKNYESKFHLNSIVYNQILQFEGEHLVSLRNLKIPKNLEEFANWDNHIFGASESNDSFNTKIRDFNNFKGNNNIKIFFRPRREFEIMNILDKILGFLKETCKNLLETFTIRFEQYECKELHSKRRKTLENLLSSLPTLWYTMSSILEVLKVIFISLQEATLDSSIVSNAGSIIKFLKNIQKSSENLVTCSHYKNNKWEKSMQICSNYKENLIKNFKVLPDFIARR